MRGGRVGGRLRNTARLAIFVMGFARLLVPAEAGAWAFIAPGSGTNDWASAVLACFDGDVITAGPIANTVREAVVMRHDGASGEPRWRFALQAPEGEQWWGRPSLVAAGIGRVVLAAQHVSSLYGPVFTATTMIALLDETTGSPIWVVTLPGVAIERVAADSPGDVIAAGAIYSNESLVSPYVTKLSAQNGSTLWEREISIVHLGLDERFEALAVRADGDLFVSGRYRLPTAPAAYSYDHHVVRLAGRDGTVHWDRGLQTVYPVGLALAVDAAGEPYAANDSSSGTHEISILRLAANDGVPVWRTTFGGSQSGYSSAARSIALDGQGSLFLTGATGESTFFVLRLDASSGALIWRTDVPNPASPEHTNCCGGTAIRIGPDGHPVAAGMRTRWRGIREAIVVKLDVATGVRKWITPAGLSRCSSVTSALDVDPSGAVMVGLGEDTSPSCSSSFDYRARKLRGSNGREFFRGCGDDLDDDGDGVADEPDDYGCRTADDPTEEPDCDDGLDNDRDGSVDFPADTSCFAGLAPSETSACSNGTDDDGDGRIDLDDPGCFGQPWAITEAGAACGIGFELTLLLGPLRLLRSAGSARRRRSHERSL